MEIGRQYEDPERPLGKTLFDAEGHERVVAKKAPKRCHS